MQESILRSVRCNHLWACQSNQKGSDMIFAFMILTACLLIWTAKWVSMLLYQCISLQYLCRTCFCSATWVCILWHWHQFSKVCHGLQMSCPGKSAINTKNRDILENELHLPPGANVIFDVLKKKHRCHLSPRIENISAAAASTWMLKSHNSFLFCQLCTMIVASSRRYCKQIIWKHFITCLLLQTVVKTFVWHCL